MPPRRPPPLTALFDSSGHLKPSELILPSRSQRAIQGQCDFVTNVLLVKKPDMHMHWIFVEVELMTQLQDLQSPTLQPFILALSQMLILSPLKMGVIVFSTHSPNHTQGQISNMSFRSKWTLVPDQQRVFSESGSDNRWKWNYGLIC
jgi:hypothetical protein